MKTIKPGNRLLQYPAYPLWAAVLPLLSINVSYLIAIGLDHLPACIPYLSGCTAVSSTGRAFPESIVFRIGFLVAAIFMVLFWWRVALYPAIGNHSRARLIAFRVLAVFAAVSLVTYASMLGLKGELEQMLRRAGINGFSVSNYLIQILFTVYYWRAPREGKTRYLGWLVALCIVLPAIGIASEVAKSLGVERHPANNVAAWNAFVAMSAYYAAVFFLWRHHQFDSMSAGRAASPRG